MDWRIFTVFGSNKIHEARLVGQSEGNCSAERVPLVSGCS